MQRIMWLANISVSVVQRQKGNVTLSYKAYETILNFVSTVKKEMGKGRNYKKVK